MEFGLIVTPGELADRKVWGIMYWDIRAFAKAGEIHQ